MTATGGSTPRVFIDDRLEAQFRRAGYVTCRVLDERMVAEASAVYTQLDCRFSQGWHADLFSDDLDYRRAVHERVGPVIREPVLALLQDYRQILTYFVVKEPLSETSRVPIHQDWTIVDNTKFVSANVFCPLVDTTPENGQLMVVPGSHRPPCRISFAPHDALQFQGDWEQMTRFMRPVPLKAGEAIIYDGRLLHGSPPNRTRQRRLAISSGFIPAASGMLLHYREAARPAELEVLELPHDFFLDHRLGERPRDAVSRGFVALSNPPVTEAHLARWSMEADS